MDAEYESDYKQWRAELYSEIAVFIKRINSLDLEDSADRKQMYSFIEEYSNRFQELRYKSEASSASTESLIELEKLIELLNSISELTVVSIINLDPTPAERRRQEKRRREKKEEQIEEARDQLEEIEDKIQDLDDTFEED